MKSANKTIGIDTDEFTNVASGPCPKSESISIRIKPPDMIPNTPAINDNNIASSTT